MRLKTKFASGFLSIFVTLTSGANIPTAQAMDGDWEKKWSVITIDRDGAWGASTSRHKASARLAAIRICRSRSGAASDCGERTAMVLGGWSLAYSCGQRTFVVAETTLAEAQLYARYRETEIRFAQSGGIGLPPCRLVVKIDPDGTVSSD